MSARQITSTITLPDGEVFGFRKLSAKHLRKAIEAQLFAQADFMERLRSVQDRIQKFAPVESVAEAVKPEAPESAPVLAVDPLAAYDRHTLVRLGALTVNGAALTAEEAAEWADDLSVDDLQAAAEAVLKLTDPKAFQTPAEREAAQKNG